MLWVVPESISVLQREDDTLKLLFDKVGEEVDAQCVGQPKFVVEQDVLFAVEDDQKHLVVPVSCWSLIMHLAHTLLWAGRLGHHKTYSPVHGFVGYPCTLTSRNIVPHAQHAS